MSAVHRIALSALLGIAFVIPAASQDAPPPAYGWKTEMTGSLSLTQAGFSNWAQGGENALAWQTSVKANFTRTEKKYSWVNKGKFLYGLSKVGDTGTRKSADELKLETVYTRKMNLYLNPFFAATAITQFAPGYTYDANTKTQVSGLLDPGYFTQSAGLGYSRTDEFKTRLGATIKETVTRDFPIPYADDPGTSNVEKTKVEGGITSTTEVKRKLSENMLYTSELVLFSNLKSMSEIDVDWSSQVVAKVAKYVNVTLSVDVLYDKDIVDKWQLKEVLSLGLTYSIF